MIIGEQGGWNESRAGYQAALAGVPYDLHRPAWWRQGYRVAVKDGQCAPWQAEHCLGPWIDDWNRLDAFAAEPSRLRPDLLRPWLFRHPAGVDWSVATCGRICVVIRRAVKWIEPARPGAPDLKGILPYFARLMLARQWRPLAEVELPAPKLETCEDFWACMDGTDPMAVVLGLDNKLTRPMTYDEAVACYGEDAEGAWAPWERSERFDICGRDVAVPFLRRIKAWLPGARVALDVKRDKPTDPLSGDFMGGYGFWIVMPIRRD